MKVATIRLQEPYEGHDEHYFASLDGDVWVGVTRLPEAGEEDQIQKILDGNEHDGKHFLPMTFAERGLRMIVREGDTLEFGEV